VTGMLVSGLGSDQLATAQHGCAAQGAGRTQPLQETASI
jgi:hypothetical protein